MGSCVPRVTSSAMTSAAAASVLREPNENGSATDIASGVGEWCFDVVESFKALMVGVVSWRKAQRQIRGDVTLPG